MSNLKGIFFDQDGVIVDTEKDGHRIAFNKAFKVFGYQFEWDVNEYHDLLKIAGGKERMAHYLHTKGFGVEIKPDQESELLKQLHETKTEIFINLIESGSLPLRPGILRLMEEANKAKIIIGICTTSSEKAARAISTYLLKDIQLNFILAGDIVTKKKPDPEIYQLALRNTGLNPNECIVIEDSSNGLLAAKGAGLQVLVTTNPYTENENFNDAELVVTNLGDPDGEKGKLIKSKYPIEHNGVLSLDQIIDYFG
jgi:HAD superfamily hydrolase (TIGR01509 family)